MHHGDRSACSCDVLKYINFLILCATDFNYLVNSLYINKELVLEIVYRINPYMHVTHA